jgi:two-component system sensor histidine kinase/response regulator
MTESGGVTVSLEGSRVLIVDDMPQNIQVLGTTLRSEKYQIYVAQNGFQAVQMANEVNPDLILLDIMMPEMDGFEACAELKKSPKTRDIPIIFLTAKAETDDVIKGFELGAADYVTKPFKASELLARVRTQLSLKASYRVLETANQEILIHSQERKALVHILCHDLANPLGTITSLLNMRHMFPDFEEILRIIESAAKSGMDVIELVREMQALEEKELQLSPLVLHQCIDESLLILKQRFSEKQLAPVIEIDENLQVLSERVSFVNSVLSNLLTNAIKFSYPNSEIHIKAQSLPQMILITIEDFGMGMPEVVLEKLFDIQQTSSRKGTNGEKGTGFGMPLVEKFVLAYGGRIEVNATEKVEGNSSHGTRVRIWLNAP